MLQFQLRPEALPSFIFFLVYFAIIIGVFEYYVYNLRK